MWLRHHWFRFRRPGLLPTLNLHTTVRKRFTGSGAPRAPRLPFIRLTHTTGSDETLLPPLPIPSLYLPQPSPPSRTHTRPRTPLLASISVYTRPGASSGKTDDWLGISSRSSRGFLLLTASVPLSLSEHGSGGAGSQRRQGAAPHPHAVAGGGDNQGQRRRGGGVHAVARHARHGAVPLGGRAREAQAPAAADRLRERHPGRRVHGRRRRRQRKAAPHAAQAAAAAAGTRGPLALPQDRAPGPLRLHGGRRQEAAEDGAEARC
jgi:hypothetical protein